MSEIDYCLNVQVADNPVTVDDLNDHIFAVSYAGTADKERIIAEMMKVNPGLEIENLRMVVDIQNRVITDLLLRGMKVNNGLFEARVVCRGVAHGTTWNPAVNSLYVHFQQSRELREAVRKVKVNVEGQKPAPNYIAASVNSLAKDRRFVATAGRNFSLKGKNLKLAGDDPSVGITLTDKEGNVIPIEFDRIDINQPKFIQILMPESLAEGVYTLTLTTQFAQGHLLKTPRSMQQDITVEHLSTTLAKRGTDRLLP